MTRLQELRQKLAAKLDDLRAFLAKHGTDEEMSAEEQAKFDAELDTLETEIKDLKHAVRLAEVEAEAEALEQQISIEVGLTAAERREQADDHGWDNFGEYAAAVVFAGNPQNRQFDERLIPMADAPGSTRVTGASGTEGGFLVPPAFSSRVREYAFDENAFLPLTSSDPIAGNSISFPVDETTPWGTSGVLAYWEGEGQLLTKSAISTEQRTMRLKKLTSLVPVTQEMVDDASLLNSRLPRLMGRAINWKTNNGIMNGSGVGLPLGLRNALNTSLITQAKVSGQAADTIVAGNVTAMYSRNTNPGGAYWVISPDAWPQLPLMTIGDQPVWTSNVRDAPAGGLLLGRPVIMSDTMQTLGDAGDIGFYDFMAYDTITKSGGISFAESMHLWFDYDMVAFRATFRMDGAPAFDTPITPPNTSTTRSPFVDLAART